MKRHLLIVALYFICAQIEAKNANGNINFIAPGIYQVAYHSRLIYIQFDPDYNPDHHELFATADLTEKKRYAIVKIIKDQIDVLPEDIIETYLQIEIIPSHIIDGSKFGFSHKNQIVIDVGKTKPGMSYDESIKSSLANEIGKLIFEQNSRSHEIKTLETYLKEFYLYNHDQLQNGDNIFKNGFVSKEAAGISQNGYSVSNEMAELFAHLTCIESQEKIYQFLETNPASILQEKIIHFVSYLEDVSQGFDQEYFFNDSMLPKKRSPGKSNNQNTDQLLAIHELKSNETYDFTAINSTPEFDANIYATPSNITEFEDFENIEMSVRSDIEEEQIETVFNSGNNNTDKKKPKKTKRKKDGSGLLLVGGLIYLTLQLLSQ